MSVTENVRDEALIQAAQDYIRYANDRNVDGMLSLFAEDAVYINAGGLGSSYPLAAVGWDNIYTRHKQFIDSIENGFWDVPDYRVTTKNVVEMELCQVTYTNRETGKMLRFSAMERLEFNEEGKFIQVSTYLTSPVEETQ